ncbi:MAG: YfcE family phosphodiesterase [Candidatus Izemoplasmatales bacterium]|jgi:hypothetical protein|nr:YfcE family phosphodiesterase [Candidatus Izemoplasmatales bacterium]MDD4354773.1 YfcE family phosphodiesterase [Candidatus Izemoplasmatales bacterium]MDD5601994.1 YfcE family phosphodiesterase [Candidatus Izemoplasmatales bacterium]MDY0372764.1 YfcE family phosphodiesterase [Candidatus Izemoplasmatales bacterium]NLF48152.1 YfcE family phosphodiesterase [Acholeplasmataceae bacterium]
MKILIFSDNHRNRDVIQHMLQQQLPVDHIFSLGDSEMSETELSALNIIGVRGNYPFEPKFPDELVMDFSSVKILFTHGHTYHVKSGRHLLYQAAYYRQCQIAFYGHTHAYRIDEFPEAVLVNPGSLAFPRVGMCRSYALLTIRPTEFQIELVSLDTGECLESMTKPIERR